MCSALVVGNSMNLVDDYGLDIAKDCTALVGSQKDVERLGRSHQNVRRALQHGAPLMREGVAGSHGGANLRHQQTALTGQRENLPERPFQIFLNVVSQSLERRNVENFRAVGEITGQGLANE